MTTIPIKKIASATGLGLLTLVSVSYFPFSGEQQSIAASGPTPVNQPMLADTGYIVGPGDRLQIAIFDAPEYSGESQVLADGSLNRPLVGRLLVKGMTLEQLEQALGQRYARYFRRAIVTVSLLAPRPLTIGVSGEVNKPGTYVTEGIPTLSRLLQQAGGITQSANVRQIQIRRPQRSGSTQVITADLWQYLQSGDLQQDITLRDGDSIFVATNTAPNPAEALQLADATFAADKSKPLSIVVVGEVYRPGSYVVTAGNFRNPTAGTTGGATASVASNATVTQAIQVAGGIKPQADLRRIQIRRPTRSGTEQIIAVDLFQLVQAGDLRQDVILQSGDTITIPVAAQLNPADAALLASASFAPDTIRVNMVGEVKQPGSIQLPPNTTLSQALLAAGGFDPRRAKQGSVQLIRLNPDGTALRRDIPVDFAKGINEQTNPVLRNNDIVVIGRSTWTQFSDGVSNILPIVGNVFGAANFLNLFGLGL